MPLNLDYFVMPLTFLIQTLEYRRLRLVLVEPYDLRGESKMNQVEKGVVEGW
jgi:hypothetical protein